MTQPPQQGFHLARQRRAPVGVARGVVEIGQHQVLPDEDAEFVA